MNRNRRSTRMLLRPSPTTPASTSSSPSPLSSSCPSLQQQQKGTWRASRVPPAAGNNGCTSSSKPGRRMSYKGTDHQRGTSSLPEVSGKADADLNDDDEDRDEDGNSDSSQDHEEKEKVSFISCARGFPVEQPVDFHFDPPPMAPTFRPTEQEFAAGPLAYIASIRHIAEPFGICKIIPPASFQPKFAVDMTDFRFTPRVQRLNELEAKTRLKMNFLEQVIKFWDLQGSQLKIPYVEKRPLDLHTLHTVVQSEGGFEICTRDRKWSNVATRMNYTISRHTKGPVASVLRQHYERLLFPYDVLMSGATIGADGLISRLRTSSNAATLTPSPISVTPNSHNNTTAPVVVSNNNNAINSNTNNEPIGQNGDHTSAEVIDLTNSPVKQEKVSEESESCIPSSSPSPLLQAKIEDMPSTGAEVKSEITGKRRGRRRAAPVDCKDQENENEPQRKMLRSSPRKNAATIAGRRMMQGLTAGRSRRSVPFCSLAPTTVTAAASMPPVALTDEKTAQSSMTKKTMSLRSSKELKKLQACVQCGDDSRLTSSLVTCVDCNKRYHMHCLIPALNELPRAAWHCPPCIALLVQSQPQPFTHEFGFAQSQREYSLADFAAVADKFKSQYFRMPAKSVPLDVVEKEFWRIMSSMEDAVTVEYGADLQNNEYGSGFAAKCVKNLSKEDETYLSHAWNLNNLPIADGSLFQYVNQNISGMIVPWMYVGMCFSTFCWHNEDHWSYSINFLHWGEAKSWYGVPGSESENFESAMTSIAPELFASQPDLLQQLVTICNPNILQKAGIPIFRCHQMPGEFVVTFPRSYHAGYNQGMNFAEAVNFAPADWLPIGRSCVSHYARLSRFPVFSHDELICKMALDADLDPVIAKEAYFDALSMVQTERQLREQAMNWGIVNAEKELFEELPDDERQCDVCKTTCYLSAVTCLCSPHKLVCVTHRDQQCNSCPRNDHYLKYRYTLDDMPSLLRGLQSRFLPSLPSPAVVTSDGNDKLSILPSSSPPEPKAMNAIGSQTISDSNSSLAAAGNPICV